MVGGLCYITLIGCSSPSTESKNQNFQTYFKKVDEVIFKDVILEDILIEPHQNGYLVMDGNRNQFVWFNKKGKLKKTFGGKGKGPGEFVELHTFTTDNMHNIYAFDRRLRKFSVFDSTGKFIRDFQLDESFRSDEIEYANGLLYTFNSFTHSKLPTFITVVDPTLGKITNRFFRTTDHLETLSIPLSGSMTNLDIEKNKIIVTHPLQLKTYVYNFNGNLIQKFSGTSTIFKTSSSKYEPPAPLHTSITAIINSTFVTDSSIIIGIKKLSEKGWGNTYIDLYNFKGSKTNKNPILIGNRELQYVNSQDQFYFIQTSENVQDSSNTTLSIYKRKYTK